MIQNMVLVMFTLFVVMVGFIAYEVCMTQGIITGGYLPLGLFIFAPIMGYMVGRYHAI